MGCNYKYSLKNQIMNSQQLFLSQLIPYKFLVKFGPEITKNIIFMIIQLECSGLVQQRLDEINNKVLNYNKYFRWISNLNSVLQLKYYHILNYKSYLRLPNSNQYFPGIDYVNHYFQNEEKPYKFPTSKGYHLNWCDASSFRCLNCRAYHVEG